MEPDTLVNYTLARYTNMETEGSTMQEILRGVARFVAPSKEDLLSFSDLDQQDIDGNLFDITAISCNNQLAAGLLAYMCPVNEVWFSMEGNEEIGQYDDVRSYYNTFSSRARVAMARSNFYLELHEAFLDMGWAGLGTMLSEWRKGEGLWFKKFDGGRYFIAEGNYGEVEAFCQKVELTNSQAVSRFGIDNLSEAVREEYGDGTKADMVDRKHEYVHMIMVRPDRFRESGKLDKANKPVADIWIELGNKHMCQNGGYDEMPIFVMRCNRIRNSVYGRSPAMDALPAIRELNFINSAMDAMLEKQTDPSMLVPDTLPYPINNSPGGVTYYDGNRPDALPRELNTRANSLAGEQQRLMYENQIKTLFYTDVFNVFSETSKRMATFEAMQLADEKLTIFHPMQARFYSEFAGPLLKRVFALMVRNGMAPPLPPRLRAYAERNGPNSLIPEVVYSSKIARAAQAVQTKGAFQVLQVLPTLAAFDPGVVDNFDLNKMIRGMARAFSVSEEYMMKEDTVKKLQKARAEQQQMMTEIQIAKDGSEAAKNAADAGLLGREM